MILLDAMKNYLHQLEPLTIFPMPHPDFAMDGPTFDDYRWQSDISEENESQRLYDQAVRNQHEKGRYHSWELVSEQVLLKDCDLSFWKYKGATIPHDLFWFFGVEDMERSTRREIVLTYQGHDYKAHLERERHQLGRVRIFWSTELQNKLAPLSQSTEKQSARFYHQDNTHYQLSFLHPEAIAADDNELQETSNDQPDGKSIREGRKTYVYSTKYERSPKNRLAAIKIHGTKCMACGFDFEKVYGKQGKDFIEVHHVKPLHEVNGEMEINPETDLVCLCSNCHRMIHRDPHHTLSLEELKKIIAENRNKS
ncbi:HNH endonuclease [Mitsuokella sp. WILCCON 0060]|uniref:HNH endonuclease n=1 Tax=Mitsuokella sp. WILCCON 0060 TaxID=3345341 RepID=UPI003F1AF78E